MITKELWNMKTLADVAKVDYQRLTAHFREGRKLTRVEAEKLRKVLNREGMRAVNMEVADFMK